jgi:hypothetical protein
MEAWEMNNWRIVSSILWYLNTIIQLIRRSCSGAIGPSRADLARTVTHKTTALAAPLACRRKIMSIIDQAMEGDRNYAKNNNPLRDYVRSAQEPERFRAASCSPTTGGTA